MVSPEIKKALQQFFISARAEREDALQNNVTMALNEIASRNMLGSSFAADKIRTVYADELKLRFEAAWEAIEKLFEKRKISFLKDDEKEVEELLKQLVDNEKERLFSEIGSRFKHWQGPSDFQNSILVAIAASRNKIFPKISAELNFFTASKSVADNDAAEDSTKRNYVDGLRIEELKGINNQDFDLARLIQLCEEINVAYKNKCYISIAMVTRAIIDHIPPIFGSSNFSEVANNYAGTKSFKDSMKLLDETSRNVANLHLHGQIRKSEILPTFTQVNFMANLDLLLSEIIRLLRNRL